MTTYWVDFSPHDFRIEIEASSPEEALRKFKELDNYEIMTNSDKLDGIHEPLEPFLITELDEDAYDNNEDLKEWSYDPISKKLEKNF